MEAGAKCRVISLLVVCLVPAATSWTWNSVFLSGTKAGMPLAESIATGAQTGMSECERQFTWDRWNCPPQAFTKLHEGEPATRERSFMHAITAAGVVFTITKNCSRGELEGCSCSGGQGGRRRDWKWDGCSENVEFGSRITKQFLDALETGQDAKALVNLHNNLAGRTAVKRAMRRVCKCHGMSGSCATQTCWLQLENFAIIGNALKKEYRRASRLRDTDALVAASNSVVQLPQEDGEENSIPNVDARRLVYLDPSPNFCLANKTAGWLGTVGRECSRARGKDVAKEQRSSCRKLCRECGLQVARRIVTVKSSCNCRFKWCCSVECDTCVKKVARFTCVKPLMQRTNRY
ncbi:protein Wnt-8b-like [Penaeus vannamei]|uniref:protein Wnt-8b-like n=1 Tax=Penaeus vannamei TaxID=6689 RepID=UPI00387F60F4